MLIAYQALPVCVARLQSLSAVLKDDDKGSRVSGGNGLDDQVHCMTLVSTMNDETRCLDLVALIGRAMERRTDVKPEIAMDKVQQVQRCRAGVRLEIAAHPAGEMERVK